jgi:uncharacterized protein (UPF0332 family)
MFYMTQYLLLSEGLDTSTHKGVLKMITYGSLIFERGGEIGLKLEDEQSCKRKDRKSR